MKKINKNDNHCYKKKYKVLQILFCILGAPTLFSPTFGKLERYFSYSKYASFKMYINTNLILKVKILD